MNKNKIDTQLTEIFKESIKLVGSQKPDTNLKLNILLKHGLSLVQPIQDTEEFIKCKSDIFYFISEYLKFNLYEWQKECIGEFEKNDKIYIEKQRQIGFTTILAIYVTWKSIFFENQTIGFITVNQEHRKHVKSLVVDFLNKALSASKDKFFKIELHNNDAIKLNTGNGIYFRSSSKDSVKGLAMSLIVLDEFLFFNSPNEVLLSSIPALSTNLKGKLILGSTKRKGKLFKSGVGIKNYKTKWNCVPGRDINWIIEKVKQYGVEYVEMELI